LLPSPVSTGLFYYTNSAQITARCSAELCWQDIRITEPCQETVCMRDTGEIRITTCQETRVPQITGKKNISK